MPTEPGPKGELSPNTFQDEEAIMPKTQSQVQIEEVEAHVLLLKAQTIAALTAGGCLTKLVTAVI